MNRSRREFLEKVAALAAGPAAAGSLLGGCASAGPTVYRYTPSGNIIDLLLAWYPELTMTGGSIELRLTGTEKSVLVVRTGIDRFAAVSAVCGEERCRVELRENYFWCPCDRAKYGLDGAPMGGASQQHLESYRTEFRETSLRIFLG
jgi:nitrite reductase/ring-hydroxylating ferredoxin subunit